jgi:hypothetical protein
MAAWVDDYTLGTEWEAWRTTHAKNEWVVFSMPQGWNPRTPRWGLAAETLACVITAHDGEYINGGIDEQLVSILGPYMKSKQGSAEHRIRGRR